MVDTTSLVSYWKLDEASGTLTDSHGSNDGTGTSITYGATGVINDAITFNGTTSDIACGNDSSLTVGTDDYSVSVWIKTTASTDRNIILSKGDGSGRWTLYSYGASGDFEMQIDDGVSTTSFFSSSGGTWADGNWHHLVVSCDRSGNASFYLDGSAHGTSSITSRNQSMSTTDQFRIGKRGTNTTQTWNGTIDEVGYWIGHVLTSTEASDLYNSGNGLAYPFTSGTTVNPSAVSLSLTNLSPSYLIDVTTQPVALSLNIGTPSIPIPKTISVEAIALSLNVLSPDISADQLDTKGSLRTKWINPDYPVEEGLTAIETKQTGRVTNLIPEESSNVLSGDSFGIY